MDRLKDFANCSKKAFMATTKTFNKSYVLFIIMTIQLLFHTAMEGVNFQQGFTGVVIYIMDVVFYSFYAQCLHSLVLYGNSGKKSLDESIGTYFAPMMQAMFMVYLFERLVKIIFKQMGPGAYSTSLIVYRFLASAVLELVYLRGYYRPDVVVESGRFVIKNIITWGIYAFLATLFAKYFTDIIVVNTNTGSEFFLVCLFALGGTFIKIFQGNLFKILEGHSYRQRKFMRY